MDYAALLRLPQGSTILRNFLAQTGLKMQALLRIYSLFYLAQ